MRNVRLAEILLSLVTTEASAAAIAGDLVEESKSRRRFWIAVLETWMAQMWRGLAADPWAIFRGAMLAMLVQFLYFLPLLLAILLLSAGLGFAVGLGLAGGHAPTRFMTGFGLIGGTLLFPLAGRWIARRYPGEEGSRVFAFVVLQVITGCGFSLASSSVPAMLVEAVSAFAEYTVLTFLGVAWWRSRNHNGVAHA